jgi:hypothetical protein
MHSVAKFSSSELPVNLRNGKLCWRRIVRRRWFDEHRSSRRHDHRRTTPGHSRLGQRMKRLATIKE